jgi:hypothetical protein
MKVVLKFPVYVSIETDNVDRAKVSKAAREILYPEIVKFVAKQSFNNSVIRKFRGFAEVPEAKIKFLSEYDLIQQVGAPKITNNDEIL